MDILRAARDRLGWSQSRMGRWLGYSTRHVSAIEQGRRTTDRRLTIICEAIVTGWRPPEWTPANPRTADAPDAGRPSQPGT